MGVDMVGEHYFRINSIRNSYYARIKMKYNILCGNSGTGKTLLVDLIREARWSGSIIRLESDVPVYTPRSYPELQELDNKQDGIVVIDEDNITDMKSLDNMHRFVNITEKQSHYYILITRKSIEALHYSCSAIFYIEYQNKGKRVEHILTQRHIWKNELTSNIDPIIVETAKESSNLYRCVLNRLTSGAKTIVIVGDAFALGSQIDKLVDIVSIGRLRYNARVLLFLPESF